jgi:quercetin dioxygenase-like cupin family protein
MPSSCRSVEEAVYHFDSIREAPMNHEHFEAALRREGFDIARRTLAAGTLVAEHAHPFDVRALVLNGEITLTVDGEDYAYREGDIFVMPAGHRHMETIGPAGVEYLVGRRRAAGTPTDDAARTS